MVRQRLVHGKMFEGCSGGHAESGSVGSSRGSTWREWRHKRREDKEREQEGEQSGLGEGSYQTRRTISRASRPGQFEERDQEVERLCRLVRDLELEARGSTREGTEMIEKKGKIVWGIDVGGDPTSLALVHVGIIPIHKNHADVGATPIPENHIDAGTVLILGSRIEVGSVHIHAGMLTRVQIP